MRRGPVDGVGVLGDARATPWRRGVAAARTSPADIYPLRPARAGRRPRRHLYRRRAARVLADLHRLAHRDLPAGRGRARRPRTARPCKSPAPRCTASPTACSSALFEADQPTIESTGGHRFTHATSRSPARGRAGSRGVRIEIPGGTGIDEPAISGSLGLRARRPRRWPQRSAGLAGGRVARTAQLLAGLDRRRRARAGAGRGGSRRPPLRELTTAAGRAEIRPRPSPRRPSASGRRRTRSGRCGPPPSSRPSCAPSHRQCPSSDSCCAGWDSACSSGCPPAEPPAVLAVRRDPVVAVPLQWPSSECCPTWAVVCAASPPTHSVPFQCHCPSCAWLS